MHTPAALEARSLAMHRRVAEKIRQEPRLFDQARETLARWRTQVDAASMPYLDAWDGLLAQGIDACLAVVTEDSPRAAAPRQCSPFAGIPSHRERFALLKIRHDPPGR